MKTKRIIYNTAVRFVQEIRTAAANMRTLGTSRFHTRRFRYNNRVLMALAISVPGALRLVIACSTSSQTITAKIDDDAIRVKVPSEIAKLFKEFGDDCDPELELINAALSGGTQAYGWEKMCYATSYPTSTYKAGITSEVLTSKLKYTEEQSVYRAKMQRETCRVYRFSSRLLTHAATARALLVDFPDTKGVMIYRPTGAATLYVFETVKNETRQGIVEEPIVEAYTVDRNTKVLNEKLLGAYYLSHRLAKRN